MKFDDDGANIGSPAKKNLPQSTQRGYAATKNISLAEPQRTQRKFLNNFKDFFLCVLCDLCERIPFFFTEFKDFAH